MSHYYSEHQESELKETSFTYTFESQQLTFSSGSGVFSKDSVDRGTNVLLQSMIVSEGSNVLDVGCGIGIVGVIAAKMFKCDVVMSDVNIRALSFAKQNLEQNGVKAAVVQSNLYENIKKTDFDVVLSNPPQSAGKKVCLDLISGAKEVLKSGGSLQLVARKNKGGATLAKHMEDVFGNVEVLEKSGGFWVYKSVKN